MIDNVYLDNILMKYDNHYLGFLLRTTDGHSEPLGCRPSTPH